MKHYRTLIVVAIILAVAIVLDLFGNLNIIGRQISTHFGLDLVGGVQALLEADLPSGTTINSQDMNTATSIVENRVNGLGVAEAVVQRAGQNRIVVEIPGVVDQAQAIKTIQTTGLLEFVDMTSLPVQEAQALMGGTIATDFGQNQPGQVVTPTQGAAPTITPTKPVSPTQKTTPAITTTSPVTTTTPVSPSQKTTPGAGTTGGTPTPTAIPPTIYHTIMTGSVINNVGVQATGTGGYEVAFELNSNGAKIFSDFTTKHVGQVLAIVLDKKVISAPTINTAITEGKGVITGGFTADSANALAIQLRYGSLPIPLKVVEVSTVGPTLGQDSLNKSKVAGAIGLGAVILFMILYYRLPGLLADLALICYALITYAIFRTLPVTLTLPGIAGFVLSIGMAVDANILIFERMKEELRAGRTLRPAIDLGWGRAWPSIRDSNFSTLITCAVLFWFGSTYGASIVKGFSLTLAIGVMVSLFTAIIVTRTFLHLVLDNIKFVEHPKWFGI